MQRFIALFFIGFSYLATSQVLLINELDPDNPGIDDKEIIELKSETPNFSTDGYILVFFNGSSSGGDSSYLVLDLNGYETDINGLLTIGSVGLTPAPQVIISDNVIQNGADAVGIYQAAVEDFPEGTLATQTNLIDALVYGTNDSPDTALLSLLGESEQYNDNDTDVNLRSIQRFEDGMGIETYSAATPTPRRPNDGSGITINPVAISVPETMYNEGDSFTITFTAEIAAASDINFSISLANNGFNNADFTGNTNLTITAGQTQTSTTLNIVDDALDEGDEVLEIQFNNLEEPVIPFNNTVRIRIVDNDFTLANFGTPVNPTFGNVTSTQPEGYYDSLDNLSGMNLRQALQDILADPNVVRTQTYADVIDILLEADQNPLNSNEVWLVYTEEGRPKLDLQTSSSSNGKWNREHTYPRSRGDFFDIEEDEIADGIDVFWTTNADSLRHGNSDAHALRAADASENSSRGNQHYGEYVGPTGNAGSFKGDVARSVLYMAIRYNDLAVVNGFPEEDGELGDLATLLDWHRNDPPDDFEMNRNNVVYAWQRNRNPFIDQPLLVEYIWGNNAGETWMQSLSVEEEDVLQLAVYPNPSTGRINFSGLNSKFTVEVYSIDGKLLFAYDTVENYIELDLVPGIYLLKLTNGPQSLVERIILK